MADGVPMDPHGENAASRTLPLGTTAKITNVETGKTAVVTIEDRGPYVDGRLVDLSPATARKIGITERKGIAKVVVAPIVVPLPDGGLKVGAAAHEPETKPDQLPLHDKAPVEKVAKAPDWTDRPARPAKMPPEKPAKERPTRLAAAGDGGGNKHDK